MFATGLVLYALGWALFYLVRPAKAYVDWRDWLCNAPCIIGLCLMLASFVRWAWGALP